MISNELYCGRFAPSPTGRLHAGSLTTALGSYLEAKSRGGRWLVRIEDLDGPRTVPGAADDILRLLERFGFAWDGPVVYQSQRHDLYRAALDDLIHRRQVYRCSCTRREIQARAVAGVDGMVYPGTCRNGCLSRRASAWRLRVSAEAQSFVDRLQGPVTQHLETDVGDFVLLRADGCWAYQLAVVVDDALQGVNNVVRGADLLVSTPRQIWLQHCLGLAHPGYCHLPLLVNGAGEKLSKQTLAPEISSTAALDELLSAMARLGFTPEECLNSVTEFWFWAKAVWSLERVPKGPIFV